MSDRLKADTGNPEIGATEAEATCVSCIFFKEQQVRLAATPSGRCRRWPGGQIIASHDWCGEFRRRVDPSPIQQRSARDGR